MAGRFTAKVGPLPVWAWAVLLLIGGYLVYRLTGQGAAAAAPAAPVATGGDPSAVPDASLLGGSTPAGGSSTSPGPDATQPNVNDQLLSQLSGFGSSIDALSSLVQSSPAFWPGSGDSGSGSLVPNTAPDWYNVPPPWMTAPAAKPKVVKRPAPRIVRPAAKPKPSAKVTYYTYKPGTKVAPAKKAQVAPKAPPKKTLHYTKGKGYYYA
jgi:hypothetical protein